MKRIKTCRSRRKCRISPVAMEAWCYVGLVPILSNKDLGDDLWKKRSQCDAISRKKWSQCDAISRKKTGDWWSLNVFGIGGAGFHSDFTKKIVKKRFLKVRLLARDRVYTNLHRCYKNGPNLDHITNRPEIIECRLCKILLESVTALYERHFWHKVLKIVLDSDSNEMWIFPLF